MRKNILQPVIRKFRPGSLRKAGHWTSGRWYPNVEYRVPGSFAAWGLSWSYRRQFYTMKYARQLAAYQPLLYLGLHEIDPASEEAQTIIAYSVAVRMGGIKL